MRLNVCVKCLNVRTFKLKTILGSTQIAVILFNIYVSDACDWETAAWAFRLRNIRVFFFFSIVRVTSYAQSLPFRKGLKCTHAHTHTHRINNEYVGTSKHNTLLYTLVRVNMRDSITKYWIPIQVRNRPECLILNRSYVRINVSRFMDETCKVSTRRRLFATIITTFLYDY